MDPWIHNISLLLAEKKQVFLPQFSPSAKKLATIYLPASDNWDMKIHWWS